MEYIVHKEGAEGSLQLTRNGLVKTPVFDRPEWAGQVSTAMLAERNHFYQTRLGAELASPLIETNIINFDDLHWVAMDDDQNEVEIEASADYRNAVLAAALGVNLETGDISGAVTEHYIDRDNKGYTLEQLAQKADSDVVFGKQAEAQQG